MVPDLWLSKTQLKRCREALSMKSTLLDPASSCASSAMASRAPTGGVDQNGGNDEPDDPAAAYPVDLAVEARNLTAVWMVRATEQVALWYKDHVPWQVCYRCKS